MKKAKRFLALTLTAAMALGMLCLLYTSDAADE